MVTAASLTDKDILEMLRLMPLPKAIPWLLKHSGGEIGIAELLELAHFKTLSNVLAMLTRAKEITVVGSVVRLVTNPSSPESVPESHPKSNPTLTRNRGMLYRTRILVCPRVRMVLMLVLQLLKFLKLQQQLQNLKTKHPKIQKTKKPKFQNHPNHQTHRQNLEFGTRWLTPWRWLGRELPISRVWNT